MKTNDSKQLTSMGYNKAIQLMQRCNSEDGFLASPQNVDNDRRIWARDGCIL